MFKKIAQIALHRLKGSLIDVLLDCTVGTLDEFRRARKSGEFDLFKQTEEQEPKNNNNADINDFSRRF